MTNRLRSMLPTRLAALLAVVWLLGMLGLAARGLWPRGPQKASVPDLAAAGDGPVLRTSSAPARLEATSPASASPRSRRERTARIGLPPFSTERTEAAFTEPIRQALLPQTPHPLLIPAEKGDAEKRLTADSAEPSAPMPQPCAGAEGKQASNSLLVFKQPGEPATVISLSEPMPTATMPTADRPGRAPLPPSLAAAIRLVSADQPPAVGPTEAISPEGTSAEADQPPPGLLLVGPRQDRSWNLELIAREADTHSRRGFELAGRSAYLSARAEFIVALRLMAQGLDTEEETTAHSRALAAGLAALKEAEDFIPRGSQLEADLDLATIIPAHRTPVLKNTDLANVTPLVAIRSYFTYAQGQLSKAAGKEVAGSMALYGLGKLHQAAAGKEQPGLRAAEPKAMVFFQAALLVNPGNYMASNDLGVLLAQAGRYEDARTALEHSLSVHPTSSGWHNLAVVYQQLGRADLARRASEESLALEQRKPDPPGQRGNSEPAICWVDAQRFAQSGESPVVANPPRATANLARKEATSPASSSAARSPAVSPAANSPATASPSGAFRSWLADHAIWTWLSN
jgi:tetratricopeptide (TPR) repeat protein